MVILQILHPNERTSSLKETKSLGNKTSSQSSVSLKRTRQATYIPSTSGFPAGMFQPRALPDNFGLKKAPIFTISSALKVPLPINKARQDVIKSKRYYGCEFISAGKVVVPVEYVRASPLYDDNTQVLTLDPRTLPKISSG